MSATRRGGLPPLPPQPPGPPPDPHPAGPTGPRTYAALVMVALAGPAGWLAGAVHGWAT